MKTLHPHTSKKYRHKKRRRSFRRTILITSFLLLITFFTMFQYFGGEFSSVVSSLPQSLQKDADSSNNTELSKDDWKLILVNRWNPIPSDYHTDLTELLNDQSVDSRIYPELQEMFDDARAAGVYPSITSSYRTSEEQEQIMKEKIADYQAEGYSLSKAKKLAEEWVALPGTSEHEIGLAIDVSTEDSSQQDASIVWEWLLNNSYKYGFIRRYPDDKQEITGVIHEPWHFRYVGKTAAREIYEQDVCLEEYLGQIDSK